MPNKENNNQKILYDALTKDGYDLGSFDQFSEKVKDEANRKILYETISKDNWDVGDYDNFSQKLSGSVPESNPLEQSLHVEVPEFIRSANGLSGSNTTSAYTLPETAIKRPKTTESEPEDDRLFEENMQRMKEGKPLNRVTTQSVIDANPDLGLQGSSYQPTEEEIRSYTLRNKPGMFKNRTSSLIDKPLGDAAESVEGYGDKASARVDLLKKYYSGDEFKQRIKKETGARVTDLLEQTDADLNTINEKISAHQKAMRNENWRPGMPSSRDDNTLVELRRQRTLLNNAENILDDSRKIVDEAGKKDSSWYESLGRGVRDKVFDVDSWTMGITDMAGSMNLNKVLEKADREEELDPAEQRLLDAAVTNMAVNAYYSSDLSAAYKAGQVTGESIPFMLEMAVNPISASGNATAKLLLKYGLKKFGQQIGKNVGKTIGAAAGMTATTGVPGVIGGTYDRMNGQIQFGLDDKGQLTYTGREGSMGTGEAFAKSAASRFLENHSEMVFNAFNGMGDVVWRGVQKIVPEGVNGFIQKAAGTGAGKMIRDWGNNETMKELAKRTQFHGIAGEYLEEVYNNLANVPLGEMTMEQVLDLDQNIDTFLGLAPTSVFFGVLGLGSMTAERIQHKKKMEAAFGNMTKVQRDKLAELERMSKQNGNADIRTFIKETMADPNLTREQKRQEIEYAYDIAVNNAFDEVAQEQAIEQSESRSSAQEEGAAAYASGDPSAVRESVVREEVSRERLEEVLPDIELLGRLYQADDAGRAKILGELPEEVRERAKEYLYSADKRQAVEDAIDEAHAPEVEAAEARVAEMTQHGRVTVVSLGKHGDATHTHGVVVNGLDENGSTTTNGGLIMVVPIENGPAGFNFGTYDSANSKPIQMEVGTELVQMSPEDVTESMLGSYQEDVDNLQSTPVLAGQRYKLTDESGQSAVVEVQSFDMNGNVRVLVNGQPSVFPENQLQEMVEGSRRLAVEAEYAGAEAERQAVKDAAKKEAVSLETKRILPDGRLAVFSATNGEEVSYNIVDANGKIMESDMMPASEFEALNIYEPESSSMEEETEDFEPQGEIGTKSEDNAKPEEIQSVSDGLPRKKDGTLDYDAFTPQQAYEYTSRTESPEVALEDLKSDIEESDRNLSSLREQLSSASRGKRISLRDTIRQAETENQALKEFLNTVAPAATVMAEEEVSRQAEEPAVEYPQAEAEEEEIKTIRLEDKPRKKYRPEKAKPFEATSDEMANSAVAQEILARTEPETLEELASVLLGNSIYLQMSGERATREMTGFGHKDLTPFLRMFRGKDKGGVTIEAAGDKLLEVARESYPEIIAKEGLENDNTGMAGTNAILSLISQSRTFSDISGYIRKNRIAEAQTAMNAENEYNERMEEEWIWETYHTDKTGLEALDNGDAFSESNVHTEEEIVEFYNNFADEILNELNYDRRNEGVHGQGIGESQTDDSRGVHGIRERGDNVLREAQPFLSEGEEGNSGESGQVYGQSSEDVHRQNDDVQGGTPGNEINSQIEGARAAVAANPTEAQKKAGNYKKGHVRIDGYDITIENPKGGVRFGTDRNGKEWSIIMNNDYGYIRGTEAVDGDHIDVFLSDTPNSGRVFVIDQANEDGIFDESKVMYGFDSLDEARSAYLSNYEKGWESRIMAITEVSKEEFKKWIDSSHRKTKAFSEYKSVKAYGPSIESSNVSRMQDIENRLAEIEDRKIEIADLKSNPDIGRIELAYLLIEEKNLGIEQIDLESEYSGLRAMNDESNAISEAEGSDLRFRKSSEKEESRRKPLRDRAKEWEKKVGVKVNIMESLDDVTNKDARRAIQRGAIVTGWFEESTGEVCLFMPYLESEGEIDATYIHEVVAHKGLRGLLGDKFDSFLDKVWESMPEADRTKYLSYPGVNGDSRAAADEYIAHLAENVDITESAWSKFTELFKKFLKAIGLEPKITDADIANTIKKSYQRLLEGGASEGAAGEGTRFSAKKKRALETASVSRGKHQPTVVSSADGANILNNLDNLAKEYEEKSSQSKTFLGDVANAIGARKQGSGSQYATFETVNGNIVTIRLADHNATVSNFDNRDENEGISIVVSAKDNNGITNDGDAHIVEYFYDSIDLRRADGKPLAEIVKSIKQSLYSGEYKDTTGLAERQEVNESRFRVVKDKNGKKTLVGLHNISEEKLRKAIKQGGLANPSMAVIDMDKQSHVDYGDITLVAPSSLVDKKTGKNIGTYTADAWTPIYPQVEKQMSKPGAKEYSKELEQVPSELRSKVRLYFNAYLEDGNTSGALNYWFLHDAGKNPPLLTSQSNDYTNEELDAIEAISNAGYYSGLNEEEKQKVLELFIEKQGGKDVFEKNIADRIETMKKNLKRPDIKSFIKKKVELTLQGIEEYGYDYEQVSNFYANAQRAINNRGKIDEFRTFRNAQDIVNNEGLQGEFDKWLAEKEEQFGVEEYIFVGYNNNGDRKYIPNTLENASRIMKKEGRAGATGLYGFNHFVAILAPNAGSLVQIRKKKGNLSSQEEYKAFVDKWGSVYHDLAEVLRGDYDGYSDVGYYRLEEMPTVKNPKEYVKKEYGIDLSDEFMQKYNDFVSAIKNDFPARYFETKFERPVYLNEFAAAVVPSDMGLDLYGQLLRMGIPMYEYERGNNEARMAAVDKVTIDNEGVRFRVSNRNQEIFVSNAQRAVEGIKQEKATPQQWLAMIEKNGGLKAGEDKWLGLSDWLKGLDKKSVTKEEILDFINQNKIRIEEVQYTEDGEDIVTYEDLPARNTRVEDWDHYGKETGHFGDFWASDKLGGVNGKIFISRKELRAEKRNVYVPLIRDRYLQNLDSAYPIYYDTFEGAVDGLNKYFDNHREKKAHRVQTEEINSTRLEYTTQGLENNAEIALIVPTIESWNEDDEIHFGDAGEGRAIAWIRFGETRGVVNEAESVDKYLSEMRSKYNTAEGEEVDYMSEDEIKHLQSLTSSEIEAKDNAPRILVIDEIQSKRHQEGREKGYKSQVDRTPAKMEDLIFGEFNGLTTATYKGERLYFSKSKSKEEILDMINERISEGQLGSANNLIPDAPFEKNWSELAFKRMLRYAAENGFDKVAWTTGAQQAERYSLSNVVDSISISKSRKEDGKYHVTSWDKDTMPIGVASGNKSAEELKEVFGKAVADELISGVDNLEEGSDTFVLEGASLEVGGEGMKGFYDKMLPSFVNKYVKKWGAKVQDIELPNVEESGRIMHSVDVTEAMKESVMEGQTMFRISEKGKQIQAEVDKFTSKYNSKPVRIVEAEMDDNELMETLDNAFELEDVKSFMKESKTAAGYFHNLDKIIIFADRTKVERMEEYLFHENIHAAIHHNSFANLVAHFYEYAKDKTVFEKWSKLAHNKEYKRYNASEEFLAYVLSNAMVARNLDDVAGYLGDKQKKALNKLFNVIGYDYDIRRRSNEQSGNGRTGEENSGESSLEGDELRRSGERGGTGEGTGESKSGKISPTERKERLTELFGEVGSLGLDGVLGNETYNSLMEEVFDTLPENVRTQVSFEAKEKYNGNFIPAMSDYLNKDSVSVWDKIVGVFREAFRKIGIGLDFTQNDVKYLIWRNRNRINPYSVIDRAKDIDKRFSLKVGEFGDTESTIRFRVDGESQDTSSYESKIRNLEKAISRYENSDQIRKELIDLIDKELGSEFVGEITKQELRSLLLQVKNAKERRSRKANQAALVKILMNIQSVVLNARRRKYQRNLDKLLSLKVQDVNGKNMSIAKNVDDSTRKIFSYMKGRVADLKISGYDEDIQYLKKEIRGFNEQIQRLERQLEESKNSEKTKVQTEIDRILSKIDENKTLLEELKQLKADVEEAKLRQGDINLDREMKLLEEKMDDAAKGEATWTLGDSERLAALNIIQSLMLNKEKDYEVRTIEEEIEKLILNNSSLYKKLPSLTGDNREKINRQIEENRRQIAARTRLINDVRSLQVQQLQETIAQMNELIANGKNSLLKKIEDEAKRKSFLIGKALRSVEGKPVDIYDDKARRENWAKKFFSAPLGSFEYMAKRINTKTLGQDGFFYKYFVEGKEGVIEAENTYLKGMTEARRRLDEKTKEIFGKKFETVWKNSDKVEKNSGVYVYDTFHQDPNGYGVKYEKPLSKGQAMYIYMAWKMTDGRTKLEVQGFDEESIAEVVDFIGDDYVKLADWIQEELLSDLREKYNEKYLQMYNTSMANIPNYVPLRIRKEAVRQESDLSEDKERKKTLEERAGSLINRVANTKPVDITMSAFDVIFDHIKQMEEWNAYARVRRDLDAILSNTDFRNQLNANQRGSFENFYDAAAVATRSNRPDKAKYMDEVLGKLSKGIVGGNIAFRLNTALKQLLSAPAFFGYSQHPYFAGHLLKNVLYVTSWTSSYRWAKENIPSFRERVESGTAGNEKLNDEAISKALDKYIEWGMIPNKLVDAFVCSVGAKSIYDFKYGRLKAAKVKEEEAKRQAVMEADIYYNATQQSSHPAFMSPVQMSRTFTDRMLTTYQNSNIGYVRRWLSAMYDIMRSLKWKDLKKNYTDMYMEQGLTRETAEAKAVARIFNENRKAIVTIALFSYGLNWLWDRGSQGLLGYTGGDDPEEEEKNPEEKLLKDFSYLVTTPIKGLPGGNLLVSLSEDYGVNPFLIYDEIESNMKEIKRAVDKYGLISPEIAYKALDLTTRIGGVDLEVWGNAYMGLEGAFRDGIGHEDDGIINLMLFLNSPKSQREDVAKNIYKDMSVLEYARAVQRAAKYVPKDDPWESWVPGVKEYSKRKESELKKEYKSRQN